jgi:hypothetical protein
MVRGAAEVFEQARCKDGGTQHFFALGADACSLCGWKRYGGAEDAKIKRLTALQGRSTKYEVALVHDGGRRVRLTYTAKTRPAVWRYIDRVAVQLVAFCGADRMQTKGQRFGKIGPWTIVTTGRTEREAIIGGELPAWGGVMAAPTKVEHPLVDDVCDCGSCDADVCDHCQRRPATLIDEDREAWCTECKDEHEQRENEAAAEREFESYWGGSSFMGSAQMERARLDGALRRW